MVTRHKGAKVVDGRRRSVLAQALEIANRGDRLFVSMAEGLAESALAALSVARSSTRRRSESDPSSRSGVDLVSAVAADSWDPLASGARVRAETGLDPEPEESDGHEPGVAPLLRALGRIVAEHRSASYATLDGDERFWTLLSLLQTLRRPLQESPARDDDGRF